MPDPTENGHPVTPVSVWLADHSWPQVAELIARGYDRLLLILGATEQHGPHLPLSTDTLVAERLAQELARRLGDTLVAPVIPVGTSDEHKEFAGTLSLSKATLAALIGDIGGSAVRHGFRRLLVLTAHGGNFDAIRAGVAHLREQQPSLAITAITELGQLLRPVTPGQQSRLPEAIAGWHAGERETSQMLYLKPELVQMEKAEAGYVGDMAAIMPRLVETGLQPVTPNGVLGDPRPANAERGALYLAELVESLVELISRNKQKVG